MSDTFMGIAGVIKKECSLLHPRQSMGDFMVQGIFCVTGEAPEDWRTANVMPVFRKGIWYTASSYQPISLTCTSSKVMEHIVLRCIMDHADKNNLLHSLQHGL